MKVICCIWILTLLVSPVFLKANNPDKNEKTNLLFTDSVKLRSLLDEATASGINNPEKSIQLLSVVEEYSKKSNFIDLNIKALHRKGIIYTQLGNYDIALKYLFIGLKQCDSACINPNKPLLLLALGNVYLFEKKFNLALNYYEKALQCLEFQNSLENQAGILMNMGNVYSDLGNYDKALSYILKALKMWEKDKNPKGIAFAHFNIGSVFQKQKNYSKALEYSLKSLNNAQQVLNDRDYSYFLIGTGEIYLKLKDLDKAQKNITHGIALANKIKAQYNLMDGYFQLAKVDSCKGNFNLAFQHIQTYNTIKDSLYNKEKDAKIANLEMSYAIEEANRNIKDLKRENKYYESNISKQKKINHLYIIVILLFLILSFITAIYLISNRKNQKKLKLLNADLESYKNHLEKIIEERTRDLVIAKNKAVESDNLKSAFLANISHEIRTPLNAIVGFSEFLTSVEESPENRKLFAQYIHHNVDTLLRLINDILDLSVIESGHLELKKSFFDLNGLLLSLAKSTNERRKVLGLNEVTIELIPENNKTAIYMNSDEIRIRQILSNLLDNALKFTSKGYIRLGYRLQGNQISFFVDDTGKGIPEKNMDKIFERFYKIENTNEPFHRGTGLGLAICNQLAGLLGGVLSVESVFGKGSTFYLTIHNVELSFHEPVKPKEQVFEWDENLWKNQHILIVEDEFTNFHYLKLLLPKSSIITWAKNGSEAIDLTKSYPFKCVLMDIKLPEYDGIMAAKTIKSRHPDMPIIFQTAYAMKEEIEILNITEFEGFIIKPYTKIQLMEALSKVVK